MVSNARDRKQRKGSKMTLKKKKKRKEPPVILMLTIGLGIVTTVVGAFNCATFKSFEPCAKSEASKQVDTTVQAAVACHGDRKCMEEEFINLALFTAGQIAECKANETSDGSPQ